MRKKQLKDRPVTCSFCKEKKANWRIVGGHWGGRTTCDDCYDEEKKKHDEFEKRWGDREESEGERQAFRSWNI